MQSFSLATFQPVRSSKFGRSIIGFTETYALLFPINILPEVFHQNLNCNNIVLKIVAFVREPFRLGLAIQKDNFLSFYCSGDEGNGEFQWPACFISAAFLNDASSFSTFF